MLVVSNITTLWALYSPFCNRTIFSKYCSLLRSPFTSSGSWTEISLSSKLFQQTTAIPHRSIRMTTAHQSKHLNQNISFKISQSKISIKTFQPKYFNQNISIRPSPIQSSSLSPCKHLDHAALCIPSIWNSLLLQIRPLPKFYKMLKTDLYRPAWTGYVSWGALYKFFSMHVSMIKLCM